MDEDQPQHAERDHEGAMVMLRWLGEGGTAVSIVSRYLAVMHYLDRTPQVDLAASGGVSAASISNAKKLFEKKFGVIMPVVGRRKDKRPRRKKRKICVKFN